MKQSNRYINKHREGSIDLVCDEAEDVWYTYNIIRVGDTVSTATFRKVTTETGLNKMVQRVRTMLSLRVEKVDFDSDASLLHVKGRNVRENEYVKIGQYHTLEIRINQPFRIFKEQWDTIDFHHIKLALDPATNADVAAVIMHEGLANICLLKSSMTIVRAKIDMQIPRKRKESSTDHDKGLQRFLDMCRTAFLRHVDLKVVKCVLLASRGFINEQFLSHLVEFAQKTDNKLITDNRKKFILAHANSGFKHALRDVLADPTVAAAIADTKSQEEVKALDKFYELMAKNPARAFYGFKHVKTANDSLAIDTLMVSDALFRSNDVDERKKYVELVESARSQGASVLIYSSMHVTGEQLTLLSGVAAVLRYPMEDLDDEPMSDSDDDDDKKAKDASTSK